jgi:ribonuclease G
VHDGDTVLVQVNRPADGDKGPQLTADISLPGRYAVLTPCRTKVSVSRSIEDDKERQRLIELAETVRDRLAIEGMDGLAGWVLRTAAEGVDNELLEKDMEMIAGIWTDILDKGDDNDPPCLLHQDLGGIERGLRDFIRPDTASVTIQGEAAFRMARSYCQKVMPQAEALIKQSESGEILFDRYDINGTIDKALNPRVDLPSGGWITIETTEAMTTIDVNSGSHSDPALAINLEAVAEIANQVPLRAVGGLIAIDFIDMSDEADGKKIEESLLAAFEDDRVPVRIGQMSNFGVIEMTRKRDRLSLLKSLPTGYFDDPDLKDD